MWRGFTLLGAASAVLLAGSPRAAAEPAVTMNTTYYSITGTTSAELKAQMRSRGPQGYWAYTRWYVRWSGDCRISLEISYGFPKWENQAQAPAELQAAWNQMMTALRTHEQGHAENGRSAAREIEASRCAGDPKAIVRKWAEQDKVYDAQTNHGRTQGVVLP